MNVLPIRPKSLTVRYESYGPRNQLPKVRTWQQRQRLQVDVCKQGNRRRNGIFAHERARVRAVRETGQSWRAWDGLDLAWAGACRPAWVALGPRELGRAWVAPELAGVAADRRREREEKRRGRKGRKKRKKRRKERSPGERKKRERKRKNFECARVFRRSKPDYIAFGFFVKHEKLPIYPFKKKKKYTVITCVIIIF